MSYNSGSNRARNFKSASRFEHVRFWNFSRDYFLNCTPLGPYYYYLSHSWKGHYLKLSGKAFHACTCVTIDMRFATFTLEQVIYYAVICRSRNRLSVNENGEYEMYRMINRFILRFKFTSSQNAAKEFQNLVYVVLDRVSKLPDFLFNST